MGSAYWQEKCAHLSRLLDGAEQKIARMKDALTRIRAGGEQLADGRVILMDEPAGWYWQEGDEQPVGPFESEQEARDDYSEITGEP